VDAVPEGSEIAGETRGALVWDGAELGAGNRGLSLEWLEADGLGGFASGTAAGPSVRGYHGWYAPPGSPAAGRFPLVAGCEEFVWCEGELASVFLPRSGTAADGSGPNCLARFALEPFPTWRYETEAIAIERTLCLVRGRSIAIARYSNCGRHAVGLRARPLLRGGRDPAFEIRGEAAWLPSPAGLPRLSIRGAGGQAVDESRAAEEPPDSPEGTDGLWSPVSWDWVLAPGQAAYLVFSREEVSTDPAQLLEAERRRRQDFLSTEDPAFDELVARAEVFVVDGDSRDSSIVGGYPGTVDWSRDSMISLPGLTLAVKRPAGASRVLAGAAARFREDASSEEAGFASGGDAALWFVLAVEWFTRLRRDPSRPTPLLGTVRSVLSAFREGRRPGIGIGPDGLISGALAGRPLTWMDAVLDGVPVTPRYGRAVEVNALWHAALKAAARLERLAEEGSRARELEGEAWHAAKRFNEVFWSAAHERLYDVVGPDGPDASLRPNQIFAVSLSEDLLPPHRARAVYWAVRNRLLTRVGLRTLDPEDPRYRGSGAGSPRDHALALHQGAAWPWLLGAFADAHFRVLGHGPEARRAMAGWLGGLKEHVAEAGIGFLSEVFDGDDPHAPRGCLADARGVAEIARILYMYLKSGS
jgi:glycogen debranching enzyme